MSYTLPWFGKAVNQISPCRRRDGVHPTGHERIHCFYVRLDGSIEFEEKVYTKELPVALVAGVVKSEAHRTQRRGRATSDAGGWVESPHDADNYLLGPRDVAARQGGVRAGRRRWTSPRIINTVREVGGRVSSRCTVRFTCSCRPYWRLRGLQHGASRKHKEAVQPSHRGWSKTLETTVTTKYLNCCAGLRRPAGSSIVRAHCRH